MSDTVGVFTPQKLANVTDQGFCFRELGVKHLLAHLSTGNDQQSGVTIHTLPLLPIFGKLFYLSGHSFLIVKWRPTLQCC